MTARSKRVLKETRPSARGFKRKQAANLSVDAGLLAAAKAAGINLSGALEHRLNELLREKRRKDWLEENREAIKSYNRFVEKYGVFSDGLRKF